MEQNDVFDNQARPEGISDDRRRLLIPLFTAGYVKTQAALELLEWINRAELQTMPTRSARAALDWLISHRYARAEDEQPATERLIGQLLGMGTINLDTMRSLEGLAGLDARLDDAIALRLRNFPAGQDQDREGQGGRRGRGILRGLGAVAAIAAGCFLVYDWLIVPPAVPACDERGVKKTLAGISFDVNYKSRMNPLMLMAYPDALTSDKGMISFGDEQEMGYDKADDSRGCTAVVYMQGMTGSKEIGYTITRARDNESKDDFMVQTLPYALVEARYSATGLNRKLGAPIGRDAMRAAMVNALGKVAASADAFCPGCKAGTADNARDGTAGSAGDDEASRQTLAAYGPMTSAGLIMQIHPVADCRKLNANQYACSVQVEYQPPRSVTNLWLNPVDLPPMLLKSDFVFERAGNDSGSSWKMADGFDKTLAKAVAENMLASEDDKSAGDKSAKDKPAASDAESDDE